MSILLLLNDKCFYFPILLRKGRILQIFYMIVLIKWKIWLLFAY